MRFRAAIFLCFVLLASLTSVIGVQAQEGPWPLAELGAIDPAPWRTDASLAALGDETAFLELAVSRDSYRFQNHPSVNFGHEKSIWFGTDAKYGHIRGYLYWVLPRLPGTYVSAAVYLPIGGSTKPEAMLSHAYHVVSPWDEDSAPSSGTGDLPIASFTVPSEPGWVHFDATNEVKQWFTSANYGLQLRGPESAQKTAKGMFAREADPGSPTATLVITYIPDREAPACSLRALPLISASTVDLSFACNDAPTHATGLKRVIVQKRAGNGAWETCAEARIDWWYVSVYGLVAGTQYAFRVQAEDYAGNLSAWTADAGAVTTIETIPPVIRPGAGYNVAFTTLSDAWFWKQNAVDYYDPPPSSEAYLSDEMYVDESVGRWQAVPSVIPWQVGHTYRFLTRVTDGAGNKSNWFGYGPATVVDRYVRGVISDAYNVALDELPLTVTPTPLNAPVLTTRDGFTAFLLGQAPITLMPQASQYVLFPQTTAVGGVENVIHWRSNLYPVWNAVANGDFDAGIGAEWNVTGPLVTERKPFWNSQALHFGEPVGVTPASIQQVIHVPADMLTPTLSWWGQPYEKSFPSAYASFRIAVTDPDGLRTEVFQQEITPWYAPDIAPLAVDMSQWSGKTITLTLAFDPGTSTTAGYWLDEIRMSPLPMNVGLRLAASTSRPASDSEVVLTLQVHNYRDTTTWAPIEVSWPDGWSFLASSIPPTERIEGKARFAVLLDPANQTQMIDLSFRTPSADAKPLARVKAALLEPLVKQDYVPANNEAVVTMIMDGRPLWLPIIQR